MIHHIRWETKVEWFPRSDSAYVFTKHLFR